MDRKNLLKTLAYLISFIFLVNFLANMFYWYSSISYFDMIMHFLGGAWVALLYMYLFPPKNSSIKEVCKILAAVLLVGAGWEVYEIFVNDLIAKEAFDFIDTSSDVVLDLSGGALATLYFFNKIALLTESEVHPTVEL